MQLPASKKLSAPEPSNACRKKSARIDFLLQHTSRRSSAYEWSNEKHAAVRISKHCIGAGVHLGKTARAL